jgi:hypothetical protein
MIGKYWTLCNTVFFNMPDDMTYKWGKLIVQINFEFIAFLYFALFNS